MAFGYNNIRKWDTLQPLLIFIQNSVLVTQTYTHRNDFNNNICIDVCNTQNEEVQHYCKTNHFLLSFNHVLPSAAIMRAPYVLSISWGSVWQLFHGFAWQWGMQYAIIPMAGDADSRRCYYKPVMPCWWILAMLYHIDGSVQERRNSSALAMELRLSRTNPLTLLLQYIA